MCGSSSRWGEECGAVFCMAADVAVQEVCILQGCIFVAAVGAAPEAAAAGQGDDGDPVVVDAAPVNDGRLRIAAGHGWERLGTAGRGWLHRVLR
ncbi:MAG: hypothetical protein Fur0032_20860 [Terrimicrobiaceae bacterium]